MYCSLLLLGGDEDFRERESGLSLEEEERNSLPVEVGRGMAVVTSNGLVMLSVFAEVGRRLDA